MAIGQDLARTAERRPGEAAARKPKRARSFLAAVEANAVVELALILPFAITLMAGIFEYGMAVYTGHAIQHGARAGAQYAVAKGFDSDEIEAAVEAAAQVSASTLTVDSREYCECSDSYGTEIDCNTGTCTAGIPKAEFVEVTVAHAYTPIFEFLSSMTPATINGAATIRVP